MSEHTFQAEADGSDLTLRVDGELCTAGELLAHMAKLDHAAVAIIVKTILDLAVDVVAEPRYTVAVDVSERERSLASQLHEAREQLAVERERFNKADRLKAGANATRRKTEFLFDGNGRICGKTEVSAPAEDWVKSA